MKRIKLHIAAGLICLFCLLVASCLQAQTLTTIKKFGATKGGEPMAALVQGSNGNFYSTTLLGGSDRDGTVFEITPEGDLSLLYSFCISSTCTTPAEPQAPLVQYTNGNFYGTSVYGGTGSYGTVFEISPSGNLTTLYSFCSLANCADGQSPMAGLVLGTNGNFYGTTYYGGAHSQGQGYYGGTVFEITPTGKMTVLHNFCSEVKSGSCIDGANPQGGLTLGSDGNFYGTTWTGGAKNWGSIFKITPTGKLTTVYSFCPSGFPCPDGNAPASTLVQSSDGNFYGTTRDGGTAGLGTVFKVTPGGQLTTLHTFCLQSGCPDGATPWAGLALGTDGNLYGATYYGGNRTISECILNGCGTLFQVTPSGTFTSLYTFCANQACPEGAEPFGGLIQATDGNFYGTTSTGGLEVYDCNNAIPGCGTVFSLSMGLGPFVQANPTFSKVGRQVGILGNNVTGTTNVTFNGVSAGFQVVSSTLIKATVPSGATTGTIEVTTPSGTLNSNLAFQILP